MRDRHGENNPGYKHGCAHKRIYSVYYNMIDRCHNPNYYNYHNYGARGITVCKEWREDKKAFFEWAFANGYEIGLSLDRIDNDKGYSPENCRWTTQIVQSNNRRTNRRITINGETHTISEWARIAGILKSTLRERIQRGWTGERLLMKTSEKKAQIQHILKDGSKVESIRDIVIKSNQFPQVYKVVEELEENK